jgi:hypothetical protein
MNLDRREIWVTAGSLCTSGFRRLDTDTDTLRHRT